MRAPASCRILLGQTRPCRFRRAGGRHARESRPRRAGRVHARADTATDAGAGCPAAAPRFVAHGAALALAFALLTVMHVVLGELVPKIISLERAGARRSLDRRTALLLVSECLSPGRSSARRHEPRGRPRPGRGATVGRPFRAALQRRVAAFKFNQARERGILAPSEERFMLGAMSLGQLRVREIMVPRPDVYALPVDAQLERNARAFCRHRNDPASLFTKPT